MQRLLLYFIGVLLCLALGLGWVAKHQYDTAAYLRTENKAFSEALERAARREDRDRKVLVARQAQVASTARKLVQVEQALSEALQRNSDWSNTNVPQDVQDSLGGPSSGLPDGLYGPTEVRP